MSESLHHRKFIHVSGDRTWCLEQASDLLSGLASLEQSILWCGNPEEVHPAVEITRAVSIHTRRSDIENVLGTEFGILAIDTFCGFNPTLFCSLCGTVNAPGLIVVLSPELDEWPGYPDPDYERLCSYPYKVSDIRGHFIRFFIDRLIDYKLPGPGYHLSMKSAVADDINLIHTRCHEFLAIHKSVDRENLKPTIQQHELVRYVVDLVHAKNPGVILLNARRGRGKSTALGMAIVCALDSANTTLSAICVVSMSRRSITPVFKPLYNCADQSNECNSLSYKGCRIEYMPPDRALSVTEKVDLAIIDEASSIPLPILFRLIRKFPKLLLSATSDGYEGTGMGYVNKLLENDSIRDRVVADIELTHPLRWTKGDPLESMLFDSLLVDRESGQITPVLVEGDIRFEKCDRDMLVLDPLQCKKIYALLSQSHYRTTPDDLRHFMDAPDVDVWIARQGEMVCAALLVCHEGHLPVEYDEPISFGLRRLKGHLIPQTLAVNCGIRNLTGFGFTRIIRIAVAPVYRQQGIASKLIRLMIENSALSGYRDDFIGVSFGLEQGLLEFWAKQDFRPVRLGHRSNARSGLRSVIMLKPVAVTAETTHDELIAEFIRDQQFMSDMFSKDSIIPSVDIAFPNKNNNITSPVNVYDKNSLRAFVYGNRQFECCHRQLHRYWLALSGDNGQVNLSNTQSSLVRLKVQENLSWKECARTLGFTGKAETIDALRQAYKKIYTTVCGKSS